ncbi:MAG: HAMP domain-containing histidine kinase [Defluviitaleaceae bacterium]|nr:HAMP domain-containing histidine kinase [Defluviitaleaceae bacterium]MCL2262459.1 HAMP domain-containing histidine kinase [Defluviitaleaceae bacterium]
MRIFGKQLLLYLCTLVVSFTVLGVVLSRGVRNFLAEQRAAELGNLARRVAVSMENFSEYGIFNLHLLGREIQNIHMYTDATVIILDADFNVFVAYGLPEGAVAQIYAAELAPVMYGETVTVFGTSNNPSLAPLLVVAEPFWLGGEVAGAALVGVSMAALDAAVFEMHRLVIAALIFAAVLAFALHFFSSGAIKNSETAKNLREQERLQNTFIANLSHDIRSPLTSMRGFLTAIEDGTIGAEEQPHYIRIILDESERLIKLSNDILDIQKNREVALEKSVFDINDVIRKTIIGFSRRVLEKRLMVTSNFANPTDMVEADEEKIQRVLYNLLDNAVKFTPEDGEITIETTKAKNKVTVSVSDNGRGMTAEEQKYIFDRFYKGDPSRGEDKMGSGLGLSIVKTFIRAHNETLTTESAPAKGSVFTFTLPVSHS